MSDMFFVLASQGDTTPPSVPSTPYISGDVVYWGTSTDNVAVTQYELFIHKAGVFVSNTLLSSTSYDFRAMVNANGTANYCFKVRARDAAGNWSAYSTEFCQVLYITNTYTYYSLMWKDDPCLASYDVYTRDSDGYFFYLDNVDGNYYSANGSFWYTYLFFDPPFEMYSEYQITNATITFMGDIYSSCSPI